MPGSVSYFGPSPRTLSFSFSCVFVSLFFSTLPVDLQLSRNANRARTEVRRAGDTLGAEALYVAQPFPIGYIGPETRAPAPAWSKRFEAFHDIWRDLGGESTGKWPLRGRFCAGWAPGGIPAEVTQPRPSTVRVWAAPVGKNAVMMTSNTACKALFSLNTCSTLRGDTFIVPVLHVRTLRQKGRGTGPGRLFGGWRSERPPVWAHIHNRAAR